MKAIDRVRLQSDLEGEMNLAEDRAMVIDLGNDEASAREATKVIGQPIPQAELPLLVI